MTPIRSTLLRVNSVSIITSPQVSFSFFFFSSSTWIASYHVVSRSEEEKKKKKRGKKGRRKEKGESSVMAGRCKTTPRFVSRRSFRWKSARLLHPLRRNEPEPAAAMSRLNFFSLFFLSFLFSRRNFCGSNLLLIEAARIVHTLSLSRYEQLRIIICYQYPWSCKK